jgi:hypothetical protein
MGFYSGKPLIEESLVLSVYRLNKLRLLNQSSTSVLSWQNSQGESAGAVKLTIDLIANKCTLDYAVNDRLVGTRRRLNYSISLVTAPCNYGGLRYWFLCPGCGKRYACLYSGGSYFLCRRCHGLAYASQCESHNTRFDLILIAQNRAEKLRTKIRRSHHRGRPTIPVKRLLRVIQRLQCYSLESL